MVRFVKTTVCAICGKELSPNDRVMFVVVAKDSQDVTLAPIHETCGRRLSK